MVTWSLCMIVRDEEAVLDRCLESVGDLFDQIVIVDTGSADGTKAIAAKYTSDIYDYQWNDDFASARNYAFSKAKGDYIMWLDADDVLPAQSLALLLQEKRRMNTNTDILMLPYQTAFDEWGNPSFFFERERVVRNGPQSRWVGAVHEVIVPYGNIRHLDAPIKHLKIGAGDRDRNLRIYEKMIAEGRSLDARHQYYYGRELFAHERYEEAEETFLKFLSEKSGWIEDRLDAARQLAYCRYKMEKEDGALEALFYGLTLDVPRAETCCDIGRHFFDRGQYEAAIFWYKAALSLKDSSAGAGFVRADCLGFLPCIQLCLCYDRLGDSEKAACYNEKAGTFKPRSSYYLNNKRYFERLAKSERDKKSEN